MPERRKTPASSAGPVAPVAPGDPVAPGGPAVSAGERPQGASAVREALIQAAIVLFARRGINSVSVREIALQAGVNHGLVHRHFGSKEGLLGAVLGRLSTELAVPVKRRGAAMGRDVPLISPEVLRATRRQGTYWRILAYALLEGADPGRIQPDFPVMRRFVAALDRRRAEGRIDPDLDGRAVAASTVALVLGYLMFEPFLLAASGLKEVTPWQRHRALAEVWRRFERIVEQRAPAGPVSGAVEDTP